jgi:hypothetical protein
MTHVPPEPGTPAAAPTRAPSTTPPAVPPVPPQAPAAGADPTPTVAPPPARGGGCGRWALGCGATVLILLIVGAVLTWNFVGQPLWSVYTAVREVQNVGALDGRLANRAAYAAPEGGVVSEPQMERYVAVLERTGGAAQARLADLERRFEDLDGRDFVWTDAWRLGDAYAGFLRLLVETKEAQVAALNAEGFSAEEYAWVRAEVLRAAGLPGVGIGITDFADAFAGAGEPDVRPAAAPVPSENRALVERYRERLDEVAFLAALGL